MSARETVGGNRLPALAEGIRNAHDGCQRSAETFAESAIAAGGALNEAKALVKHGEWTQWLAANVGFSERTARRYMRFAAPKPKTATMAVLIADRILDPPERWTPFLEAEAELLAAIDGLGGDPEWNRELDKLATKTDRLIAAIENFWLPARASASKEHRRKEGLSLLERSKAWFLEIGDAAIGAAERHGAQQDFSDTFRRLHCAAWNAALGGKK